MTDWSNYEPTNYKFNGLLFQQKKTKQQNSDRRSRAELYSKIGACYCRDPAQRAYRRP